MANQKRMPGQPRSRARRSTTVTAHARSTARVDKDPEGSHPKVAKEPAGARSNPGLEQRPAQRRRGQRGGSAGGGRKQAMPVGQEGDSIPPKKGETETEKREQGSDPRRRGRRSRDASPQTRRGQHAHKDHDDKQARRGREGGPRGSPEAEEEREGEASATGTAADAQARRDPGGGPTPNSEQERRA